MEGVIKVINEEDTSVESSAKSNFPNFKYLIYDYTVGDYCGYGTMLLKTAEDKYYTKDLGHYSCYGPAEGMGEDPVVDSIKDIKGSDGWFEQFKSVIEEMEKIEKEK